MRKRIGSAVALGLVCLMVALAGSFLVAKAMGGGVYAVLSGSMEPEYRVGGLLYVLPVKAEELREGDVITFAVSENTTVTHRIVRVTEDQHELLFTTKGDANETEDVNPVSPENILGKPVFQLPYLGYVTEAVRRPPGLIIAIIAAAILLVAGIAPAFKRKKSDTTDAHA